MDTSELTSQGGGGADQAKRADFLLPYHKVESLMRQALSGVHSSSNQSKNKNEDSFIEDDDEEEKSQSPSITIDREAVELMQELVTEFVCFVTSDMAEDVAKDRRVALKGQDLVESLNKLGFPHVADVIELMLPKLL